MIIAKLKNLKEQKSVIKRELMFENYTYCLFNDNFILKSQQRFKGDHHKVYTEEINKITLSSNDDKRLQTSDRIEIYIIKINIKMINFDNYVNENKTQHNKNWPYIPDHPYRILMTGGSGYGKTNLLLSLIENQPDIDKTYLYAKDPYESKYQYLINKTEGVGINHFNVLLIIQIICMMFIKILMITILIKKIRY